MPIQAPPTQLEQGNSRTTRRSSATTPEVLDTLQETTISDRMWTMLREIVTEEMSGLLKQTSKSSKANMDSGASHHVTGEINNLHEVVTSVSRHNVESADGSAHRVGAIGSTGLGVDLVKLTAIKFYMSQSWKQVICMWFFLPIRATLWYSQEIDVWYRRVNNIYKKIVVRHYASLQHLGNVEWLRGSPFINTIREGKGVQIVWQDDNGECFLKLCTTDQQRHSNYG